MKNGPSSLAPIEEITFQVSEADLQGQSDIWNNPRMPKAQMLHRLDLPDEVTGRNSGEPVVTTTVADMQTCPKSREKGLMLLARVIDGPPEVVQQILDRERNIVARMKHRLEDN